MKVTIGAAKFDAEVGRHKSMSDELRTTLERTRPRVVNRWKCPGGPTTPSPVISKLDAPVVLGIHATDHQRSASGFGSIGGLTPEEQKVDDEKRAQDVSVKSATLARALVGLTGFTSLKALDAALQAQFGAKRGMTFDFNALIKDHKADYTLIVTTAPDYLWVSLSHPKLPPFREMDLLIAIPVGLLHVIKVDGECSEWGYREWVAPVHRPHIPWVRERVGPTGSDESRLREEVVRREIEWQRKRIRDLAEEKRRAEAELKEMREALERLKKGPQEGG